MRYGKVEGQDKNALLAQLKRKYGSDNVYIYDIKEVYRGFLKKKKYYTISYAYTEDFANRLKSNTHVKKSLDKISKTQEKTDYNYNRSIKNELNNSIIEKKLNEIEKKIDKFLNLTINKDEISIFEKYANSLKKLDISDEYLNFLKEKISKELSIDEAKNLEVIRDKFIKEIKDNIEIDNEKLKKGDIIILVGPTGVGKTTTLVKIATQYLVYGGFSMKFLTLDKYKVGAIHHLKNYADILKVPMIEIEDKNTFLTEIINSQHDLIFVDTLGTSQKNNDLLAKIKGRIDIKKKNKLKIYLTISATTKYDDLIDIMERFKFLNYSRVIITKIDETNSFGSVISALWKYPYPVSFITNGQDIVENLIQPEKDFIMNLLFQEDKVYD